MSLEILLPVTAVFMSTGKSRVWFNVQKIDLKKAEIQFHKSTRTNYAYQTVLQMVETLLLLFFVFDGAMAAARCDAGDLSSQ